MCKLFSYIALVDALTVLPAPADAPAVQVDGDAPTGHSPAPELDQLLDFLAQQAVNDCRAHRGEKSTCPKVYAPVCGCDGATTRTRTAPPAS